MTAEGRVLRGVVLTVVLCGIALPIVAGLWETARAAFGHLPAIGAQGPSLESFLQLAVLPGLGTSLRLTLVTGLGATLLSLVVALAAAATFWAGAPRHARVLAPFLAAPHAALAIGLAFLISPSGWIARIVSPWATGWTAPPDLPTVHDPWGIALILGLMIKEVPFLLLVILSALAQLPVRGHLAAGRALGYGSGVAWIKIVVPQVYPLIRLPVFVVLAFSMSVVDMAVVLGPSNPPTLAVAVTRWYFDPDVGRLLPASAAALTIALVVAAVLAAWVLAERAVAAAGRFWLRRGGRGTSIRPGILLAGSATWGLLAMGALSLAALALWSVTWRWSFPNALPETWSLAGWLRPGQGWGAVAVTTFAIGIGATAAALVLAIAWLEGEDRARKGRARWAEALIYLPLIVPQIAFLFGLNTVLLRAGIRPGFGTVLWSHVLFVFPYVMIALSDPWRKLDRRLLATSAALGAGPARRLFAVKLPMLLRPILTAAAIGFAVSVSQYLPTLFLGAGRVATLTTEAVTLSSGADRRITGLYALLQACLPFLAFALAIAIPSRLYRNRRDLQGGQHA